MKKLIKWFQTPRKNKLVYIYCEDESDISSKEVLSKDDGDKLIADGIAESISYEGSYFEAQKIAAQAEASD